MDSRWVEPVLSGLQKIFDSVEVAVDLLLELVLIEVLHDAKIHFSPAPTFWRLSSIHERVSRWCRCHKYVIIASHTVSALDSVSLLSENSGGLEKMLLSRRRDEVIDSAAGLSIGVDVSLACTLLGQTVENGEATDFKELPHLPSSHNFQFISPLADC